MGAIPKKRSVAGASLTGVALAAGIAWGPGAGVAGAMSAKPTIDATHDSIVCSSITAKVKFDRPLRVGGTGTVGAKITAKIENCTASDPTGAAPPMIAEGKLTGRVMLSGSDCSSIGTYALTGSMTMKWKTAKGTPKLSSGESMLSNIYLTGNVDPASGTLSERAPVGVPAVQSTGSFAGTDGGASSNVGFADGSLVTWKYKCDKPGGAKKLSFGDGSVRIG